MEQTQTMMNLPVVALRGLIIFPNMMMSIDVEREISVRALERAMESDEDIFLVTQKEIGTAQPGAEDLYTVGTVSAVRQILRISERAIRVLMEGKSRASLKRLWQTTPYLRANVELISERKSRISEDKLEALLRQTFANVHDYYEISPRSSEDLLSVVADNRDPGYLADYIAQNTMLRHQDKQVVLEELRPMVRLQRVNELLGYPYFVRKEVVHGRQLGRTLGMPTINQIPEDGKLLPPFGVYASRTTVGGETYFGISNVGVKPTVEVPFAGVETYLFGCSRDLYGLEACVEFYHFVRPECKFDSVEELREQIRRDARTGEAYFQKE